MQPIEPTGNFSAPGMREGLNPLNRPEPGADLPRRKGEAAAAPSEAAALIARASEAPDVNLEAVEEARRLIAEGKLDTPEAARRAAENLLDFGI
jgi:hypothetical protein